MSHSTNVNMSIPEEPNQKHSGLRHFMRVSHCTQTGNLKTVSEELYIFAERADHMGAAEMTRQWGVYIACAESPISATSTQLGRLTTICNSSSKDLDATTLWGHPHPSAHTTHRPAHIHIIKEIFERRVYINQIQTLIWPVSTDQLFSLRHSNKVRLCAFLPSMQYNMDLHQRHRRLSAKGGNSFKAECSWALWSG